jgi:hypothetical protein
MREEVTHDISQLNEEERVIATSPFREVEVFEAISQMEHNKDLMVFHLSSFTKSSGVLQIYDVWHLRSGL